LPDSNFHHKNNPVGGKIKLNIHPEKKRVWCNEKSIEELKR